MVFASSNFVVAGHRFGRGALTTTMEAAPINPYGASKLFGERVGKLFAERYGISFIAFRIGVCQRANNNLRGPWIPFGRWGQAMWVSDRDLCRAFNTRLTMNASPSASTMWFRVTPACGGRSILWRNLGFVARDAEKMRVPLVQTAKAGLAWVRDVGLRNIGDRLAGPRW